MMTDRQSAILSLLSRANMGIDDRKLAMLVASEIFDALNDLRLLADIARNNRTAVGRE